METPEQYTVKKHTPLPWKEHTWYQWPFGVKVVHSASIETTDETIEVAKNLRPEDAAFIVEACNSHASLTSELKKKEAEIGNQDHIILTLQEEITRLKGTIGAE